MENDLLIHPQSPVWAKNGWAPKWRAVLSPNDSGISGADSSRRLNEAANWDRGAPSPVSPRPATPGTAAAQARGDRHEHVTVIRDFSTTCPPTSTSRPGRLPKPGIRTRGHSDPDGLRKAARQLMGYLDRTAPWRTNANTRLQNAG